MLFKASIVNLLVYKPEIFQGNLKNKNYFEGWYFKHVSSDLKHVWSFIPGISLTKNDPYSFVPIMECKHGIVSANHDFRLLVSVLKSTFGELRAPVSGDMSRRIKESIDSEVTISLFDKHNNLIYNDSSKRAGLEVIDKIFDYFKN